MGQKLSLAQVRDWASQNNYVVGKIDKEYVWLRKDELTTDRLSPDLSGIVQNILNDFNTNLDNPLCSNEE
jgi:hypothetical protein